MPKQAEAPTPIRAFSEDRVLPSRADHSDWTFIVPSGTPPEALLQADAWKHVAASNTKVRARDIIRAECEDDSWMATYKVRDVGPTHIKLALMVPDADGIIWFNKPSGVALVADTHFVEWINIGTKHAVRRKSDNEIVKSGFRTAELAADWMAGHLKAIAA
jgi:hypothetical protein